MSCSPFRVTKVPYTSKMKHEGICLAPSRFAIPVTSSYEIALYRRQLQPKLLGSSSSLKVTSFRNYPFEFTLLIRRGNLSTILTQYEHQVAVKQRPKYLYLKSLMDPSCPDLLSTSVPKPDRQSKMPAIELLFIIIQFLLMIECPICSYFTQEVYYHITESFTLCLDCALSLAPSTRRNQYVFHTLLNFQPPEETILANQRLRRKRIQLQSDVRKENMSLKIQRLVNNLKNQKQESQSLTISTQQSQNSTEFLFKSQKSKMESVKEKYGQTIKTIERQLQPMKQRFSKAKDSILGLANPLRNTVTKLHTNYSIFSAQLPPIASLSIGSVKKGFMNRFF